MEVIIIGEPNIKRTKSRGMIVDNRKSVAMQVCNKKVGITNVERREGYIKLDLEDWLLFGCYISPNIPLAAFKDYIDILMSDIRDSKNKALFGGSRCQVYALELPI